MKITKNYLKHVIKEELGRLQNEGALAGTGYYARKQEPRKNPFDRFLGVGSTSSPPAQKFTQEQERVISQLESRLTQDLNPKEREELLAIAKQHGLENWLTQKFQAIDLEDRMSRFGG